MPDPTRVGLPTQKAGYVREELGLIGLDVMQAEGQNAIGWPGHPAITQIERHITIASAINTLCRV